MKLTINATAENLDIKTLSDLVELKKLNPVGLVIEYNGEIIISDVWCKTLVKDGDKIELLNFVGGG